MTNNRAGMAGDGDRDNRPWRRDGRTTTEGQTDFPCWKSFFYEADFWDWEVQRDSKNVIFDYSNDMQLTQVVTSLLGRKNPPKRAIFTLFTWKWKRWNVSNLFINISIDNHHEFNFYIFSTLFWGIPCFFTSKDNKVINLPFLLYLTLWCNLCKWIQHGLKKILGNT